MPVHRDDARRSSGLGARLAHRSAEREGGARDSDLGEERRSLAADPATIRWTAAAEARLANIPSFVRPMARTGIETFARERGALEVDEQILDAARDFFGM